MILASGRLTLLVLCQASSVMSNSLQPYGLKPSRLFCPWGSPGKNTAVGCQFLLQGESFRPRDQTHVSHVSCIGRQVLYHWRHLGSSLEPVFHNNRSHCNETCIHDKQRVAPTLCNQREPMSSSKDPTQLEIDKYFLKNSTK